MYPNKPSFYGIECRSRSVFTIRATRNAISPVTYVLHFHVSTFGSLCAALSVAVFCSSVMSCFPGMLLRFRSEVFKQASVA